MLDMGFIDDIQAIARAKPSAKRQTVMYSATFAGHVGRLASNCWPCHHPRHLVAHRHAANIEQRLHWADNGHHKNALLDHILTEKEVDQALVFTSTQRDADWLAERLSDMGHSAAPLHGGMRQGRRNRTLLALRRGELRVLVATDVAARGHATCHHQPRDQLRSAAEG